MVIYHAAHKKLEDSCWGLIGAWSCCLVVLTFSPSPVQGLMLCVNFMFYCIL